ncbi:hypothetical protein SALB_08552 [Streptomyces noursei]|uniref:A-factor biosynthesis hotdog domain-containing protein n=1 Tax=Streptomyces noursei TaxID=1971 RepID=A0A401RDQ4_STRNR|nr:hypothetical protein SALB_08552 [Streptomyces noursei]
MPAPLAVPVASLPEAASDLGPLVRKRVSDEVLITDWRTVSGTTHHVTAHWPQHHSFYTPRSGRYSSLLLVETVRQALALLSNAAYEVPLEYRLGWDYCSCTLTPAMLDTPPDGHGAEVELTITHALPAARRKAVPSAWRHRSPRSATASCWARRTCATPATHPPSTSVCAASTPTPGQRPRTHRSPALRCRPRMWAAQAPRTSCSARLRPPGAGNCG